jgi:hypothetical protein
MTSEQAKAYLAAARAAAEINLPLVIGDPSEELGSVRALTEAELFNLRPPAWEIQDRTELGGLNVIIGPRGSFKTFLVAALLLALARKRTTWLGADALRAGPVMFVPLEDLPGWRQRWQSARTAAGVPDDEQLPIYTWPYPVSEWKPSVEPSKH